jgi:hypothetical protein
MDMNNRKFMSMMKDKQFRKVPQDDGVRIVITGMIIVMCILLLLTPSSEQNACTKAGGTSVKINENFECVNPK